MIKHKVGVIGTGYIGKVHLEMLKRLDNVEIVAVAETDMNLADEVAKKFGIEKVYCDPEKLIKDPHVEVIHNCTPNQFHFGLNKLAILEGKDILSEKPLSLNASESKILMDLAEKNNTVTSVNFCYRYYPVVQEAAARVANGNIGEIRALMGHFLQDWLFYDTDYSWRLDPKFSGQTNVIADLGSHWCDLVHFVTGRKITEVMAELHTCIPQRKKPVKAGQTFGAAGKDSEFEIVEVPLDEYASLFVKLDNGARGNFTTCQVAAGHKVDLELKIFGSQQSIEWSHKKPNAIWLGNRDRGNETFYESAQLQTEETQKYAALPTGHPMGYHDAVFNLFRDFYLAVSLKKDKKVSEIKLPGFKEAHHIMCIIEASIESNKTGKWEKVKY